MTKPTVGLFGMQPGGTVENDIASITLTKERVKFEPNVDFNFQNGKIKETDDERLTKSYVIRLSMQNGDLSTKMTLDPYIQGENPIVDPTNPILKVECETEGINGVDIINEDLTFTITASESANVLITILAQDDSGVKMYIELRIR